MWHLRSPIAYRRILIERQSSNLSIAFQIRVAANFALFLDRSDRFRRLELIEGLSRGATRQSLREERRQRDETGGNSYLPNSSIASSLLPLSSLTSRASPIDLPKLPATFPFPERIPPPPPPLLLCPPKPIL